MKVAVLSDVHANSEALEAVLHDAIDHNKVDKFWFLGDAVGRGPDPVPILRLINSYLEPQDWVLGNHDAMFRDLIMPGEKNGHHPISITKGNGLEIEVSGKVVSRAIWNATNNTAIETIIKNRLVVKAYEYEDRFWRENFISQRFQPREIIQDNIRYIMVHGSLSILQSDDHFETYIWPWRDEGIHEELIALDELNQPSQQFNQVLLIGHTHIPFAVLAKNQNKFEVLKLEVDKTYSMNAPNVILNPGAVGQPRDWCVCASYMILDTEQNTFMLKKVPYDWQSVADKLIGFDGLRLHLMQATGVSEMPPDWVEHYKSIQKNYQC